MKMQSTSNDGMDIRFENRNGYLYAFLSGRGDNVSVAIKFWQCAIDECNKRGQKRLLVEQDFPNPLSTVDAFYLADAISKMAVAQLKIAFADRDREQNEVSMFVETVAVNRGVLGQVFTNLSDAETWLIS